MVLHVCCAGWFNCNIVSDGDEEKVLYGIEYCNYIQDYKYDHKRFACAATAAFANVGLRAVFTPPVSALFDLPDASMQISQWPEIQIKVSHSPSFYQSQAQ